MALIHITMQSRQVMDIFARFDENMAAASLDEAYLKWVKSAE